MRDFKKLLEKCDVEDRLPDERPKKKMKIVLEEKINQEEVEVDLDAENQQCNKWKKKIIMDMD